jgi:hypothetical protein
VIQAAPAPRFGATAFPVRAKPVAPSTRAVLDDFGIAPEEVAKWVSSGALPDETIHGSAVR